MRQSFCTIFDSVYLSRGLLMYESLRENTDDFHLYMFAFDDLCFNILHKLNLSNVTVIQQKDFENGKLLSVKPLRTRAEYCWTSTSSAIDFVLEKYNEPDCTYLDADIYFYNSPSYLLDELQGNKSVLITEHRYTGLTGAAEQRRAGRFCVQFITFKNEAESLRVLHKWRDQCIDWCYARYEEGKFGDQKYLDEWPEIYKNVHILMHQGGGVAPWNVRKYHFRKENASISGRLRMSSKVFKVVFYHFHYVRFLENGYIDLGWNQIPEKALNFFYLPYIRKILEMEEYLENNFRNYKRSFSHNDFHGFRGIIKKILKRVFKYNLVTVSEL